MQILKVIIENWKYIVLTYAIISLALFTKNCSNQKKEIERLEQNQIALSDTLKTYKTKDGKNAASIAELTLSNKEFKELCGEQKKIIDELGIKVSRLQNISTTGTDTNVKVETILKDTTIYVVRDSIMILKPAKNFSWSDTWNRIEGYIESDTIHCNYNGVDTLTVAAVRVPKKFLFFRWGTKRIDVHIVNTNPKTAITYNKTVKITK